MKLKQVMKLNQMRRLIGAVGTVLIVTICFTLTASPAVAKPAGTSTPGAYFTCPWADYPLDCWIKQHPRVRDAIVWEFSDGVNSLGPKPWLQWPASAKQDLRVAFENTVTWYNNGMSSYPGTLAPDPPPDMDANLKMQGVQSNTVFEPSTAWTIYTGHVALSLAAEIYGWVPWSLFDYDDVALGHLFNAYKNWFRFDDNIPNSIFNSVYPGCYVLRPAYGGGLTPANATYTFKFLKDNNLLRPTKVETIGQVLNWARWNLSHMSGPYTYQNAYYHWQYWGYTPLSRVIEGTVLTDPEISYFPGLHHWTPMCWGTGDFLTSVLRVANIPAKRIPVGYHSTAWFSGEKLYLSHGDDPYDGLSKTDYPATDLLINEQQFQAWFPANDLQAANNNVGRRPIELAIYHPGDWLVGLYCEDVQARRDHASSMVYNSIFKKYYSVKYLEIVGLWDRLALKAGDCLPVQ